MTPTSSFTCCLLRITVPNHTHYWPCFLDLKLSANGTHFYHVTILVVDVTILVVEVGAVDGYHLGSGCR